MQPMINTEKSKRESTVRGVSLMLGYLGYNFNPKFLALESHSIWFVIYVVNLRFDGFTSTFQDKLFKGYEMEIQNQIFFTTTCSCFISLCCKFYEIFLKLFCFSNFFSWKPHKILLHWIGLIFHGKLIPAIDFMFRHPDCFFDATVLSCVRSLKNI